MLSYINSKIPKKHKDDQGTTGDAEKQPTVEVQEPSKETTKHKHKHAHHHDADDRPTTSSSVGTPLNPVLEPEDEHFLEQLLSEDGSSPPLPPRSDASHLDWSSDSEVSSVRSLQREEEIHGEGKGKDRAETSTIEKDGKDEKKTNRLSALFTKKKKNQELQRSDGLEPEGVSKKEGKREKTDITQVLSRLNLSAKNNKVVQLSNESSQLLQRFTQIFKDLVNGVPTAYDDLTNLIEDRDGAISRSFDKLPSSLKKLVMHLPEKLTSSLAPEILLAAAESQGIKDAEGGMKEAAKKMFLPQNLSQLVTKPGALVSMLRAIVEALKARWPAFLGMNVIWSIALSLLLFLLWYCHKRGREVRMDREKSDGVIDGQDRVEELPDDPTLPAPRSDEAEAGPSGSADRTPTINVSPATDLPPPPIGRDAPADSARP